MSKILLILLLLVSPVGCGKNKNDSVSSAPAEESSRVQASAIGSQPVEKIGPITGVKKSKPDLPVVAELKFMGLAHQSADLEIQAALASPDDSVDMEYRWFVNDREIYDISGPVLLREKFSAGDWVHCRVTARKNNLESRMVKSRHIQIQGTPAELTLAPIGQFSIPGSFQYQIQARDPDADSPEQKTLVYELLSPKNAGIRLNRETGEINWELGEGTVKKFGEKVEIKFRVLKKGCPDIHSSITLKFREAEKE